MIDIGSVKINERNIVSFEKVHKHKDYSSEFKEISVYKKGSFLKALKSFDFSKEKQKRYRVIWEFRCWKTFDDFSKCRTNICLSENGEVYIKPHIQISTNDGEVYNLFFDGDEELDKFAEMLENKINSYA